MYVGGVAWLGLAWRRVASRGCYSTLHRCQNKNKQKIMSLMLCVKSRPSIDPIRTFFMIYLHWAARHHRIPESKPIFFFELLI
jgi:hypothetical protein